MQNNSSTPSVELLSRENPELTPLLLQVDLVDCCKAMKSDKKMVWIFIRFFFFFFFISPQRKVLQMVATPRTDNLPSPSQSLSGYNSLDGGGGREVSINQSRHTMATKSGVNDYRRCVLSSANI